MQNRFLKRAALISLIAVFTVSFASYSILSYIPPAVAQHELAYSVEHCPSHNAQPTVHVLTEFQHCTSAHSAAPAFPCPRSVWEA